MLEKQGYASNERIKKKISKEYKKTIHSKNTTQNENVKNYLLAQENGFKNFLIEILKLYVKKN